MPRNAPHPTRNFLILAIYQIVWRCGWIFKTESIIMPVVLDLLGAGAWVRSCLPLLNRFGLSIPPLLMARRVKVMRRKKWGLAACTTILAFSFLALSGIWATCRESGRGWLPLVFLVLYAVFFMSNGVNQMCFNTLQGKLVATTHRGRLMLVANVVGSAGAIGCVFLLLPKWLTDEVGRFELIFGFAALCFALSAMLSCLLAEAPDDYQQPRTRIRQRFVDAWLTVHGDARFRRLAIVAALFGSSLMLFPHYQALARGQRMGIGLQQIMWWLIVQNVGTAISSLAAGPLADRRGNRLVLRVTLLALCGAPISALWLSHVGSPGQPYFPLVFLLVGLTPVIMRMIHNYTLEMSPPKDHPRYLSTISLCMAAPMFLSPLVGVLIEWCGFDIVFCAITALPLIGWVMTFGLHEPRHRLGHEYRMTDDE